MARSIIGTVSSSKGDKTIVVTVQTRKTHPLYRKQYTVTSKFMAHDEKNEAQTGDKVFFDHCRCVVHLGPGYADRQTNSIQTPPIGRLWLLYTCGSSR